MTSVRIELLGKSVCPGRLHLRLTLSVSCGCADYAKSFGASTWGKIKDGEKGAKEAWEKKKEEKKDEEKKDEL